MRRFSIVLVTAALAGCFATVGEDGRLVGGEAAFTLTLPAVLPLVVVQPGLSVVRDSEHEVYFADGYYWARQDRSWYRTRDHRGRWTRVEQHGVPAVVHQSPPGRYRHYRGDGQSRSEQEHGRSEGHGGDHR